MSSPYNPAMGIRLVYGLQTGDESYLDIFYPSRRLKEAALAAGVDYAAMIHSPSDPLSRVLDFCYGQPERHTALLRGELPDSLFSQLEAKGIRVINPSVAVALARDKLASAGFFESIGAQHPRTMLTQPDSAAVTLPLSSSLPLPLPFVAKPRYGKMGRGVALMESQEQWSEYQAKAFAKDQDTIVQEFIGAATGRDIRFFFADFATGSGSSSSAGSSENSVWRTPGWRAPGWICVMRSAPGFLSNAHAGGSMTAFCPPVELQREAERIFTASGLVYGTVDFLFAEENGTEFMVCEMNANPGFEELERAMKMDVASAIIASANIASAIIASANIDTANTVTASTGSTGTTNPGKEGTP